MDRYYKAQELLDIISIVENAVFSDSKKSQ